MRALLESYMDVAMVFQYDSISKCVTIRCSINELSNRDKVELFRQLMDDLGITERFSAAPDETSVAQSIITEQWSNALK